MLPATFLAACSNMDGDRRGSHAASLTRFEFEQPQMGMPFRIVLYSDSRETASLAAGAAFKTIADLNMIFSNYEFDSEVSRLSRSSGSGVPTPLSDPLWEVLSLGQELASKSDGAFDVTVGPATALWRKARREKLFPEERLLSMVRRRVGYRHLSLDAESRSARLEIPHMSIDLGGIAKGYALEAAHQVLQGRGISISLVQAGGDMRAGDPPPGKDGWFVLLETPEDNSGRRHVILRNEAIATSGDLNQNVEINGTRYSHIVDPRTCIGLTNRSLVVVIADSATLADCLATTLGVVDVGRAKALTEDYNVASRVLTQTRSHFQVYEWGGFTTHSARQ